MNSNVRSRKFRGGAYATAISFLVIIVLIVVNLISGSLFRRIDVTSTGKYSLAADTRAFAESLTTPIAIYYVTSEGEEDLIIKTGAEQIAEASDLITLTVKDPVQYPQFVYRYNKMQEITNNSIIVVNQNDPDRYAYIDSEQMKIYQINTKNLTNRLVGYDAEVEIVKAIVDVTQEKKATIYATTNHQEWLTSLDSEKPGTVTETLSDLMKLNAFKLKYCNLASVGAVPADCDVLLIGGVSADFSEDEVAAIRDYMTAGGTVILALRYDTGIFDNLQSMLGYYGVRLGDGVVCEGDSSRTIGDTPAVILSRYENRSVEWPYPAALYTADTVRNTVTIQPLHETSGQAYVKPSDSDFMRGQNDETGTYPLMLKITDTYGGSTGTMYVLSAMYFLSDVMMTGSSQMANRNVLVDCISEQVGASSMTLSIPDTTALEESLQLTTNQRNRVAMGSFLIPVMVLVIGIAVVLRRRVEKIHPAEQAERSEK